ncbi:hypothetical protein ETD86_16490 [Nonomuraea turkmeniaca]|uniref:Uncharacterized protein n=1 Tax=Nonomuraea turkmeniaca TaxID=103838 RepID=A0A5S4FK85_9ACTN|nr:hypothetical protein [Nonomuraea turkmeniaca]TMR21072.1 hypothetical protein ETD86_16490 [Nonomuraea turkmeniaca]
MRLRLGRVAPAILGAALAVLALGPALGWGLVLRYDLLFVPDPPLLPDSGGFPRAMPSDLVVALLSRVLPVEIVQKGVLVAIFVLAATGAAALVPPERRLARLVAAACFAWNIYLAQRLMLGQWALLLGVAGLPWAVRAVGMRWTRLLLALLPAAIGGFQAMLVSALTLLPIAVARRKVPMVAGILIVYSLPWAVPALGSGAVTDPAGVDAFAARADGPFGVVGSLLSLGGIWSADAGLPGQESWWLATARLLLVAAGVFGYVRLRVAPDRPAWWGGLAVAATAGLCLAGLGAFPVGREALKWLIALWPGFGPLRDGQVYLAPLALLVAAGLAAVLREGAPALVGIVAPVLVLPTLAFGGFGRLAAVAYPPDWTVVQRIVNTDPVPGALLSLPWGAHRAFAWNGGRIVLDPATKLFERRVVWDDTLYVGLPDGSRLRVRGEDPLNRRAGELLATRDLARLPVRYVLVPSSQNGFLLEAAGFKTIFRGKELDLLRR